MKPMYFMRPEEGGLTCRCPRMEILNKRKGNYHVTFELENSSGDSSLVLSTRCGASGASYGPGGPSRKPCELCRRRLRCLEVRNRIGHDNCVRYRTAKPWNFADYC